MEQASLLGHYSRGALYAIFGGEGGDGFHELGLAQFLETLGPVVEGVASKEVWVLLMHFLVNAGVHRVLHRVPVEDG